MIQTNSKEESTLTPQERARMRKAERAEREFQMLTQAAKDARINHSIGKSLQQQQFHGGTTLSSFGNSMVANDKPARLEQTNASSDGFDEVNNRTMGYSSRHNDTLAQASIESQIRAAPRTQYD